MSTTAIGTATSQPAGKAAWILLAIAWICFVLPIPGLGLFLGWPLNLVAFILAIVAMAKGGAGKGLFQLLASLIASPIIYFIGVAIFAGAVVKGSHDDYKERAQASQAAAAANVAENSSAQDAAPAAESIKITARELRRDYEANEISADAKYKGKSLLISGKIDSIQSDFANQPVVHLSAGDFAFIQLKGIDKATASELSKGQSVKAACTGGGEVIGFPVANNCTLQ